MTFILNPYWSASIPVTLAFTASTISNSSNSSYTFSSLSFGAAAANRRIVVGTGYRHTTARTINSVTIGGITATLVAALSGSGGSSAGLYIATVPTGTTGSVVVTLSGTVNRGGCGVWALYDLLSSTPTDTDIATSFAPTVSSTVSAGGVIIGYAYGSVSSSSTWTGITENFDTSLSGPNVHTGASGSFLSGSNVSITQTLAGSPNENRLIVGSFR